MTMISFLGTIVESNSSIVVKEADGTEIRLTVLKTPIDLSTLECAHEVVNKTEVNKKRQRLNVKKEGNAEELTNKVKFERELVKNEEYNLKNVKNAKILNMTVLEEPISLEDIVFDNKNGGKSKEVTFNVKTIRRNFVCNSPRRRVNSIEYQKWKQAAFILFESTYVYPFIYSSNTFKCFICLTKFLDMDLLKSHSLSHSLDELKNELNNWSREKILKVDVGCLNCKLCQYQGITLQNLKVHLKEHHSKEIDPDFQDNIIPFKLGGQTFECQICGENFLKIRLLIIHMSKHFNNFSCEVCGSVYVTLNLLKRHLQTHENGNFPCEACDKVFSNAAKKSIHMRGVHLKQHPRRCPICPERFNSNYQRTKHLRIVHNHSSGLFRCEICGREYDLKCHLSLHIRSVHLQERNFECNICSSRFFSKELLNRHVVIHTGERKFRCEVCGKSYVRRKNLKEHLRVHESFVCSVCGLGFFDQMSLMSHVDSNHGISLL